MIVKRYYISAFPKLLILGEKDPVLPDETKLQVENTEVQLIGFFRTYVILKTRGCGIIEFFKKFKNFAFKYLSSNSPYFYDVIYLYQFS
jgi:hypothetical protein